MNALELRLPACRLVSERHQRARALVRRGADSCCGGCGTEAGPGAGRRFDGVFDGVAILRAIDLPGFENETVDWTPAKPADLADLIVATHHAYLRRELPRLAGLLDTLDAQQGANHPRLRGLRAALDVFCARIVSHMNKEERFIFPLIERLETAVWSAQSRTALAELILAAEHEHHEAGVALAAMRALTDGYSPPAGACSCHRALLAALSELETDLHSHLDKENNILFPAVLGPAVVALAAR